MAKEISPQMKITDIIVKVVIALVLLIIVFNAFYVINAGERGVLVTLGRVTQDPVQPGLHFKIPFIQGMHRIDVQTQTLTFDNKQGQGDYSEYSSLFSASKDLQDVQVAVVLNFHQKPEKVVSNYVLYGSQYNYNRNVIEPIVRETIKTVSSQYTAEELVTKRSEYSDKITETLQNKIQEKDAFLEKLSVTNLEFSPSFTQAIEAKVTAEQQALAAKNKLEQIKYEAEQKVASAQGEAESISIINKQLENSPKYVEYLAVTRWDGKLPYLMGSQATPFVDVTSMTR